MTEEQKQFDIEDDVLDDVEGHKLLKNVPSGKDVPSGRTEEEEEDVEGHKLLKNVPSSIVCPEATSCLS